jgi:SNF2 family DNA or RNA helicase
VPGSGKTAVVLSTYEKLRSEGKVNTLLVVGPPSCFGPWRDEFKTTLGREPEFKILAGGDPTTRKSAYFQDKAQKPELYLVSFQTLLQDHHDAVVFMQRNGIDIFLVVDEAHYIKRVNGNWAKVVLDISKYAKFRCVLTGTPMPRSFTDIFNLFDFLWPDNSPIDSNDKIKIQQLEDAKENMAVRAMLREDIGPLFYRVRKSDLGLKPAIFHGPVVLQMNKNEKRLYDAIENRIIEYGEEDHLKNSEFVKKLRRGRIMRLRQSVSYTKLLETAIKDYGEDLLDDASDLLDIIRNYDDLEIPAKMEYLLSLVKNMQKEKRKVIIWSNFVNTLEMIRKVLAENNIYAKKIEGKTPIEQDSIEEEETREKIRKEFLDPTSGLDVLIANPAACAESISLHTTCHAAVYYDLSYNCAQYLQSLDRIHRVGGSENVDTHYYFLQYENTIDQDILQNLRDKADKMNGVIEDDYGIYNLDMGEGDEDEEAFARIFDKKKK